MIEERTVSENHYFKTFTYKNFMLYLLVKRNKQNLLII